MRVSVAYDFVAKRRSANASIVMDHFGVGFETGRHVIANGLDLPIEPGDVVCFTGESGSGKSSLLRAAAAGLSRASDIPARAPASQLSTHNSQRLIDLAAIELPDRLVIDAVGLPAGEAMRLLSAVGLGEARLMLRRPRELSDGERYRFRLALALARRPRWIVADEFTATLDRTLAKVVAYNVRRQADRTGTGFLLATTHEDVLEDLAPSLHVVCRLDGRIEWRRAGCRTEFHSVREAARERKQRGRRGAASGRTRGRSGTPSYGKCRAKKKALSLACRMFLTTGSARDWPYFARWHYRGRHVGVVRFVTVLWESRVEGQESRACNDEGPALDFPRSTLDSQPIGICVFTAPPLALRERNRYFGLSGRWSRPGFQALNRQLVTLARVVLHPTYRGAGLAPAFIRRSCECCPWPWIEAQAQMGHLNPFFEKAGFVRVGVSTRKSPTRLGHSSIYGTKAGRHATKSLITQETFDRSRHARPVYYVFDNREHARAGCNATQAPRGDARR